MRILRLLSRALRLLSRTLGLLNRVLRLLSRTLGLLNRVLRLLSWTLRFLNSVLCVTNAVSSIDVLACRSMHAATKRRTTFSAIVRSVRIYASALRANFHS